MKNLHLEANVSDEIMGIDLGTTNSAVSVYNAGTVPTLLAIGGPNKYTIPSCVRWNGGDSFTVGSEAYEERYNEDVCYSVKRIMGSNKAVQLKHDGITKTFKPYEISAEILRAIKHNVAEFYKELTKCVITVPAYFNQRQISDTLKAAELAGLECLQILKEPTSASYIYSQLGHATTGSVIIYDLGGGTFDVTHMNFLRKDAIPSKLLTSLKKQYGIDLKDTTGADNNDQYFCRVLGTYGDVNLGGDDIDQIMGDKIIADMGLKLSRKDTEKLYLKCESFKKSGMYGQDIFIGDAKIHLDIETVNYAVDKVFDKTMRLMADIDMTDVRSIVLVGGSTKSKRLRENLQKAFPDKELSAVLDPDATVALGAGSVAKAISNNTDLMYADVLPLPIGVLVNEKEVEVCIDKNTSMPFAATRTYYTLHDGQKQITVHVYQGMSSVPSECTYLGHITVVGLPNRPAGDVKVEIKFILDGQGKLRIITSVDGVDEDAELVIDNIFAVTEEANEDDEKLDDFEQIMKPLAEGNEEALNLLKERRNYFDDIKKLQEIEDRIAELLM